MTETKHQTPQQRYISKNIVRFRLDLNKKTDTKLLAKMSQCSNRNGYLKALLGADTEIIKKFKK